MTSIKKNHKNNRTNHKYQIKSVGKTLRIIERLAESPTDLKTLVRELSLGKTTVYRIISTLKSFGFVRQLPSAGLFGLGYKIQELAIRTNKQLPLMRLGPQYMFELKSLYKVNENVNLAVLDGTEVLYIGFQESSQPLRIGARVGDRLPASCTALGKVLLSNKSDEELFRLYEHGQALVRMTPNSITDFEELKKEIRKVRASGVAFDQEEITLGIKCVACPIRDYNGGIVAAMSVAMPVQRAEKEKLEQIAGSLQEITQRFSRDLGHREKREEK